MGWYQLVNINVDGFFFKELITLWLITIVSIELNNSFGAVWIRYHSVWVTNI